MENQFRLEEVDEIEKMKEALPILQELYPTLSMEHYISLLKEMLPHNYKQLLVFNNDKVVAVCGFWIGIKIWCGKYLELDNVIVSNAYRSHDIGKKMTRFLIEKAKKEDCNMLGLDVYTDNYRGVKFYMNEGFIPRGFHMINVLKGKY